VCRHWNIRPDDLYADKRQPHHLQGRAALCVLLVGELQLTHEQAGSYLGRRSGSFSARYHANASLWTLRDRYYASRFERALRDTRAAEGGAA
jgi:hypothetical protein